ncbi:MAG: hypothetical protein V4591_04475, partial [Bdellovibrionota bacterium]
DFALFCSPVINLNPNDDVMTSYDSYSKLDICFGPNATQYTDLGFAQSASLFWKDGSFAPLPVALDIKKHSAKDSTGFIFYPLKKNNESYFHIGVLNALESTEKMQSFVQIQAPTFNSYLSEKVKPGFGEFIYDDKNYSLQLLTKFNKISIQNSFYDSFYVFLFFTNKKISFTRELLDFFQLKNSSDKNAAYDVEKIYSSIQHLNLKLKKVYEFKDGSREILFKTLVHLHLHEKASEGLSQFLISKLILQVDQFNKSFSHKYEMNRSKVT